MDELICKHCRQPSSVIPNSQYIRCHRCQTFIFVGSRNQDEIRSYKSQSSQDQDKIIMSETKGLRRCLRKKFSSSNGEYDKKENPIISSKPPPRGKRALLCGVTYKKQKFELKGTAQDVINMRDLLIEQFNFPVDSILILAEEDSYNPPTRKNIEEGFQWLMKNIQFGDSLVFYFSGHGKRQRDLQGDEIDGFDEAICPVDFKNNGMILDNYINKTIVSLLKPGVMLHAIVDSCHSGTILDLPHVYNIETREWDDCSPPSGVYKGTSGGKAVCFSACKDYQLAADTSAFSPEKEVTGAMTCTFIAAIKGAISNNQKLTYYGILDSMHEILKQPQKVGCLGTAGIRRCFHRQILQDPMLSSSQVLSSNTEFKL